MARKKTTRPEADRIKGILITKTAIKEMVSEDTVEKVINFQFKDIKEATSSHEQIEISGFGKMFVSPAKLKRKIKKLEEVIYNMSQKAVREPEGLSTSKLSMLEDTKRNLEFLRTKKGGHEYKYKGNTGRNMELNICEEGDRGDSQGENGDL